MDCMIVFGSIDITADGRKAIVTLSAGDMRRSLNILQVQSKAFCVWIHHPVEVTWICLKVSQSFRSSERRTGVYTSSSDLFDLCPAPSLVAEHQHGLREGDGGNSVHLYRSPSTLRHRQHPGLVPQQRLHHSLQTYPSLTIRSLLWLWCLNYSFSKTTHLSCQVPVESCFWVIE